MAKRTFASTCRDCGRTYQDPGFCSTQCPDCHREGYYVEKGVLFNELGRVAARDACEFLGHPFDAQQAAAHGTHVDETIREYAAARARRTREQVEEELFEMRAAFGPGVEVVNVLTGERTRT